MKKLFNELQKFATKIVFGIIGIFLLYILYNNFSLERLNSLLPDLTSFSYLLINVVGLIGWIGVLYFYDSSTSIISHEEGSGKKKRTKSFVYDNREKIMILVGAIALMFFLTAMYVIAQIGISFEILPSLISALLWIHYFGMFHKEVNANKVGIIVSQITNQPVGQQEEGPITVVPFNFRTTLSEKGEPDAIEDISDKLFPQTVRVPLVTKEGKRYDGVFTLWFQWAKDRADEIRSFAGGQQGLIDEVHKYIESEAQKEAVKHTCRETLDKSKVIRTNIEKVLRRIIGNADEQEPITVGTKPMVMKRENDKEVLDYLKSEGLELLIQVKIDAGMSREEATQQIYLEQNITTESTLRTTGPGTVIASTALGGSK